MPALRTEQSVCNEPTFLAGHPTTSPQDFNRVVEAARVPVLARGGGKKDLRLVLENSAALVAQGALSTGATSISMPTSVRLSRF